LHGIYISAESLTQQARYFNPFTLNLRRYSIGHPQNPSPAFVRD
jgi:hypothetical protein